MVERRPWGFKPGVDDFEELSYSKMGQGEVIKVNEGSKVLEFFTAHMLSGKIQSLPKDAQNCIASFLPYYVVRKLDKKISMQYSYSQKISPKKNIFPVQGNDEIFFFNARGVILRRIKKQKFMQLQPNQEAKEFHMPDVCDWDSTSRYCLLARKNKACNEFYLYDGKEDTLTRYAGMGMLHWIKFHPCGDAKQFLLAKKRLDNGNENYFGLYSVNLDNKEQKNYVPELFTFDYKGKQVSLKAASWPYYDVATRHGFPYFFHPNVVMRFHDTHDTYTCSLLINFKTKQACELDGDYVNIDEDEMVLANQNDGSMLIFDSQKNSRVTWPDGQSWYRVRGQNSCIRTGVPDKKKYCLREVYRRDYNSDGALATETKIVDLHVSSDIAPDSKKLVYRDAKNNLILVDTRTANKELLPVPPTKRDNFLFADNVSDEWLSNDVLLIKSGYGARPVSIIHCIRLSDLLQPRQKQEELKATELKKALN